jgi:NACalpha-BTF3-like transcription factor
MNEEQKRQIIKAFAFSTDIKIISENTGMSEDELRQFLEDNKEAIAEEMAWNRVKEGR